MFWLIGLTILIYWAYSRYLRMTVWKRNGIPGPSPNFLTGNLLEISRSNNLQAFGNWLTKYGDVVGYYVGGKSAVLIKDVDLLKRILIKDFHCFTDRNILCKGGLVVDPRADKQLILLTGDDWKEARTIATPAFSSSKLKKMVPLINDAIITLLNKIEDEGSNGTVEFNIYDHYQGLTLDIIGRCAFGLLTDVQKNPNDPFLEATKHGFNLKLNKGLFFINILFPELTFIIHPLRYAWGSILRFFYLHESSLIFQYASKIVTERRKANGNSSVRMDLLQEMIDGKMAKGDFGSIGAGHLTVDIDAKEAEYNENIASQSKEKKSLRVMTDDEIAGNTALFLEAGFETTSTLLGFLTHILVNHQDIQERMRQEVIDLVEKHKKLDYNTVTELPYMEAVINETLRMYPPITTFITRKAVKDYKCNGFTIPKGCGVMIPVYHLHHDSKLWDSPEKFMPSRFEGANKKLIHPTQWLPFGSGPRNCIGIRFALLEAKLSVANILLKFRLEPGPHTEIGDVELDFKIISLTPKKGIFVKAIPL